MGRALSYSSIASTTPGTTSTSHSHSNSGQRGGCDARRGITHTTTKTDTSWHSGRGPALHRPAALGAGDADIPHQTHTELPTGSQRPRLLRGHSHIQWGRHTRPNAQN